MEKRKSNDGDIVPLKKLNYVEPGSSNDQWLDGDALKQIEMHRKASIYLRMEEYRRRCNELLEENRDLLSRKVEVALGQACGAGQGELRQAFLEEVCKKREMEELIGDLRCKVEKYRIKMQAAQSQSPPPPGPSSRGSHSQRDSLEMDGKHCGYCGARSNNENAQCQQMFDQEVKTNQYITKDNALFNRLEEELSSKEGVIVELQNRLYKLSSQGGVDHKEAISRLEEDNREMVEMSLRYQKEKEREKEKNLELREQNKGLEERIREKDDAIEAKSRELEMRENERKHLECRVREMCDIISNIGNSKADGRERSGAGDGGEPAHGECGCRKMYEEKIRELENRESDRVEEVAFLATKYSEVSKEKLSLEERARQLELGRDRERERVRAPGANTSLEVSRLRTENKRLEMEVEKITGEYVERKSAAMYHKRQAHQLDIEVKALTKTIKDLEGANGELFLKHKELKVEQTRTKLENRKLLHNNKKLEGIVNPQDRGGEDETERELGLYRKMVKCAVCEKKYKEVVLKKCMHMFCRGCVDERYRTRQRTCPLCGVVFGMSDVAPVYL